MKTTLNKIREYSPMSKENELLPCPFCGSIGIENSDSNCRWIECVECNAQGGSVSYFKDADHFELWNTREPIKASEDKQEWISGGGGGGGYRMKITVERGALEAKEHKE